jgi:hypothetical protein
LTKRNAGVLSAIAADASAINPMNKEFVNWAALWCQTKAEMNSQTPRAIFT